MILAHARGRDDRDVTHPDLLFPPFEVLGIPFDGASEALGPVDLRFPSQHPTDLAEVAGVARHLSRPVAGLLDHRAVAVHRAHHVLRDLVDAAVLAGRDVEYLARD